VENSLTPLTKRKTNKQEEKSLKKKRNKLVTFDGGHSKVSNKLKPLNLGL
jgi:hypothetical protein